MSSPDKDIHTSIWSRVRRFEDWLVGLRAGFGTGRDALKCFITVESRSAYSWIIPGLGLVVILAFHLLMCYRAAADVIAPSMGSAMFRIFVFDYTIFFFGLVSGFGMARRWRSNPAQVEELSLVPLPPAVMGGVFASGPLRNWWFCLVLFAIIETIICVPHIAGLNFLQRGSLGAFWEANPLILLLHPVGWVTILAILLCPWILAWFHFESIRLAHWMFAAHALPRVPLAKAGILNFLVMTGLVVGLSGLGSAVTGVAFAGIALLLLFASMASGTAGLSEEFYLGYTVWMLASIAGALMVLWLKRVISSQYESAFVKSWLLYQWWGAGESTQPDQYSLDMRRAVPYWQLYHRMREEEEADLPLHKRVNTRRYQRYIGVLNPMTPKADPGGGFPVGETLRKVEDAQPEPASDDDAITSDKS